MTDREMFEKLEYTRSLDSKKLIYTKALKGTFYCFEITFDLTEKVVELYDDHEDYTINNALLKAIQQQLKELGWLEGETCTNLSEYDSIEYFECSNCGFISVDHTELKINEDNGEELYQVYKPKYCPNCGRKIIG